MKEKHQIRTYGSYDPNRNNKHCDTNKKEKVINDKFDCDVCGETVSTNTKDKHVDSSLCKE